jgi:hypothetical protein
LPSSARSPKWFTASLRSEAAAKTVRPMGVPERGPAMGEASGFAKEGEEAEEFGGHTSVARCQLSARQDGLPRRATLCCRSGGLGHVHQHTPCALLAPPCLASPIKAVLHSRQTIHGIEFCAQTGTRSGGRKTDFGLVTRRRTGDRMRARRTTGRRPELPRNRQKVNTLG